MREEVHEMSREKRRVIYQKRMREYKWHQISLSVLIIIAGILEARQLMLLDFTAETLPIAEKVVVYMVAMMTMAALQLAAWLGQHVFKTTPWMKEFSEDTNSVDVDSLETNTKNENN